MSNHVTRSPNEAADRLFDTLAQPADYRRNVFLREVRITYLHELGHYLGWDEEQIANVGLA
jgi:predicted Zn-dependent protease with MMP-like domain